MKQYFDEQMFLNYFLNTVAPSKKTETLREHIFTNIEKLLKETFMQMDESFFVAMFGSGPLKTYLPNSDMDLSLIGESLISGKKKEGAKKLSDYEILIKVKEALDSFSKESKHKIENLQVINADVKVAKMIFDSLHVDISINQMGGVCSFALLQDLDKEFGKNFIFKKSIMLIKAWCNYESRILGSQYGCFATYALEILILYIVNNYYDSLHEPFDVMVKFFEIFSKWNWEKRIVTIYGPVPKSAYIEKGKANYKSLDELAIKERETHKELSKLKMRIQPEYLNTYKKKFERFREVDGSPTSRKGFSLKFIDIVDPIFDSNNLGKSISKSNHYRIASAIKLGEQELQKIQIHKGKKEYLLGLQEFFKNTFDSVKVEKKIPALFPQVNIFSSSREESKEKHIQNEYPLLWTHNYVSYELIQRLINENNEVMPIPESDLMTEYDDSVLIGASSEALSLLE